jgi:60 kDa SS-A/Ro ribonucleoprotein
LPVAVEAYEEAQRAADPKAIVQLIARYGDKLPRESIPPEHMTAEVWDALLRTDNGMPMTALIRNLATMTRVGLLEPMSSATRVVCEQLADAERLRSARVHPLAVLVALKTYEQGRSARGIGAWQAVPQVVDALDGAFYAAFGNVEATGKRTMLALDVSGSMGFTEIAGMPGVTPRDASAAMALVTAAVEPNYVINGFCDTFVPLTITPRQRLDDVVRTVSNLPFARTDCSLPMLHALRNGLEIDTFVIYTDSETYAGHPHPAQALRMYRERTGIPAKLVVVGMVSNGFTIADPNDAGMLDVVGMDTATPQVIGQFSA